MPAYNNSGLKGFADNSDAVFVYMKIHLFVNRVVLCAFCRGGDRQDPGLLA